MIFPWIASGIHLHFFQWKKKTINSYRFEESCTGIIFEHSTLTKEIMNPLKIIMAMPEILMSVVLHESIGPLILKFPHDYLIHRAMMMLRYFWLKYSFGEIFHLGIALLKFSPMSPDKIILNRCCILIVRH